MGTKSEVDWSKNVANKGNQLDVQLHVGSVLHEGGLVVDHKAEPPDWEQNLKLIGPIMSPPTFSCTWVQFYKRGGWSLTTRLNPLTGNKI